MGRASDGARVRQGGLPPTGKWTGSPTGGVKAPEPIVLPDVATRFAHTAARLEALAASHPMPKWLGFMAKLAQAQNAAASHIVLSQRPDVASIAQAVEHRIPPIAAETHERDLTWRAGLAALLDNLDTARLPARLGATACQLRSTDAPAIDAFADDFLRSGISAEDAAKGLFVAAALQVYFTRVAATMPLDRLRLLPQRGLCPCCGSTSVAGVVTATGHTPGARYLYCSLCSTAWNHVRAVCITCEGSGKLELESIEGFDDCARAETCGDCQSYSKVLYQAKNMQVDAYADDLATLGLDVLVAEAGWSRHAPNPLVLVGIAGFMEEGKCG